MNRTNDNGKTRFNSKNMRETQANLKNSNGKMTKCKNMDMTKTILKNSNGNGSKTQAKKTKANGNRNQTTRLFGEALNGNGNKTNMDKMTDVVILTTLSSDH